MPNHMQNAMAVVKAGTVIGFRLRFHRHAAVAQPGQRGVAEHARGLVRVLPLPALGHAVRLLLHLASDMMSVMRCSFCSKIFMAIPAALHGVQYPQHCPNGEHGLTTQLYSIFVLCARGAGGHLAPPLARQVLVDVLPHRPERMACAPVRQGEQSFQTHNI